MATNRIDEIITRRRIAQLNELDMEIAGWYAPDVTFLLAEVERLTRENKEQSWEINSLIISRNEALAKLKEQYDYGN